MIETRLIKKFHNRIAKCEEDIRNGVKVELRTEQIGNYKEGIRKLKHYQRVVRLYERANHKWFDGSANDVLTFSDIVDVCNESQFGEKPLDLIAEGVYIPIGGSALAAHDLREYLYLPASLVEDDEDYATIKKSFEGFSDDVVQM